MSQRNIANPKNQTLFSYLRHHCNKNGVDLKYSIQNTQDNKEVLILFTEYGQYGSIGFGEEGKLVCIARDRKLYRWARHEGFSEDDIYDDSFLEPILLEVSLEKLASILIEK